MAFCSKCGAQLADNAAFCPKCGQSQGAAAAPAAAPAAGAQSGLAENVASCLCYSVGWVTGLVFFLIDHRPNVKFHAAQSMVTFGALHLIRIVLGMVFGIGFLTGGWMGWGEFSIGVGILSLIGLICLVLWILCMVKAYQGERFKLPIAGDVAEGIAGGSH